MEFIIWVETRLGGKTLELQQVARLERPSCGIQPEEIGLTLQEGKTVLKQVQERIVQTQINVESAAWGFCMHCQRQQRMKDLRSRCLGTVFGKVDVFCRRYIRCTCRGGKPSIQWPLGQMGLKRNTPELSFLLAKWGSLVPYRQAAALLGELLPISDHGVAQSTVRRYTLAVGAHVDQRVTEPDEYDWPESRRQPVPSGRRLMVAIDGTYVRSNLDTGLYQHYVVSGRIDCDGVLAGRFAWISQRPGESEEFLKAALQGNGWTPESKVVVLADGADGLKNLVQAAIKSEPLSILDWFHISMRLRPIEQMAAKVAATLNDGEPAMAAFVRQKLPNVRHQMWNGQWHAAITRMKTIYQGTHEAATSLVSASGHIVNQRMGKRQPMRWSLEGAHFLLQVRCAVLDGRLEALFREWYPKFRLLLPAIELPAL
jgi:hypothetical protein